MWPQQFNFSSMSTNAQSLFLSFLQFFSHSPEMWIHFVFGWLLILSGNIVLQWSTALAPHTVRRLRVWCPLLFGVLLSASFHSPVIFLTLHSLSTISWKCRWSLICFSMWPCDELATGCDPDKTAGIESRNLSDPVCWGSCDRQQMGGFVFRHSQWSGPSGFLGTVCNY